MAVYLATAGYDHAIRFWEATTGICYRTLQYGDSQVNRLEITPEKSLLAAAGNPHVRMFDINSSHPHPTHSYDGHVGNVTAVGFHATGSWMFTGSEDGTVKIWDIRAPGCQREYVGRAGVNTVCLHPNQTELISGDQNGNVRVWDLKANACSCELVPEGNTAIRSVSAASDGSRVVAANNKGTCYVWRLSSAPSPMSNPSVSQQMQQQHEAEGAGEHEAARAQNGGQQQLQVDPIETQEEHTTTMFEPLHKLQAHDGYILKCLISPDVSFLATTSSDHTVKLWSMDDFRLLRVLKGHQRWWVEKKSAERPTPPVSRIHSKTTPPSCPFTNAIRVFPMCRSALETDRVWDVVSSVDAAYLVTASSDTQARLWDVQTGEAIRIYSGHQKACCACALNDTCTNA